MPAPWVIGVTTVSAQLPPCVSDFSAMRRTLDPKLDVIFKLLLSSPRNQ
jgi:hypothetical protein